MAREYKNEIAVMEVLKSYVGKEPVRVFDIYHDNVVKFRFTYPYFIRWCKKLQVEKIVTLRKSNVWKNGSKGVHLFVDKIDEKKLEKKS